MSRFIGYLKLSGNNKREQPHLAQLRVAGVSKIYQEKSFLKKEATPKLDKWMAEVEEGDTVVVASFDHIAYSTKHLLEIMESLNAAGVTFKAINNDIDTSTSHGKAMQAFLGTIVEFERKVLR